LTSAGKVEPPPLFAPFADLFPMAGGALDLACGNGRSAVWLARRGMEVWGVDFSPVAIDFARRYADASGVGHRCRFDVHDLKAGLPDGERVDLVFCNLFRDADLDEVLVERLRPHGMLAMSCLSEVGAAPGRFRAASGELLKSFRHLDVLETGEADGYAWLIARTLADAGSGV
jgi:SAM-dependent methyltransferase